MATLRTSPSERHHWQQAHTIYTELHVPDAHNVHITLLLGVRNPHRDRVVRPLEAAREAMAVSGFEPFDPGASLGLHWGRTNR